MSTIEKRLQHSLEDVGLTLEEVLEIARGVVSDVELSDIIMGREGKIGITLQASEVNYLALLQASKKGFHPLGILKWDVTDEGAQPRSQIFPWLKDDLLLVEAFHKFCDAQAKIVAAEYRRRSIN